MKKPHLITPAGTAAFMRLRKLQATQTAVTNLHKIGLRFALERFLHRIFEAGEDGARLFYNPDNQEIRIDRDTITLKGGLTMTFAEDLPPLKGRSTGDADLHLAAFPGTMADYAAILRRVLEGPPRTGPDDGVRFDVEAIEIRADREERSGGSVVIPLQVGPLALQVKTDVTFDARPMHARAPMVEYPSILPDSGLPRPRIRRVPFEFMIGDKFGAAVEYGAANVRIRDYHDMRVILGKDLVDPAVLADTIAATLRFKGLPVPVSMDDLPGFSPAYAEDKARRWEQERVAKNYQVEGSFPEILAWLRVRLQPVLDRALEVEDVPDWAFGPR